MMFPTLIFKDGTVFNNYLIQLDDKSHTSILLATISKVCPIKNLVPTDKIKEKVNLKFLTQLKNKYQLKSNYIKTTILCKKLT